MAKYNIPLKTNCVPKTYEGASAKVLTPEQILRRSTMSCLLWESQFYENGENIADRILATIPQVNGKVVANLAVEAREKMNLRHVPLLLATGMARHIDHRKYVAKTLERIIQRADELSEFLSLYWKDGKVPLASQVKKGLARAFTKFDEYQLAKYNRNNQIKLRDVLFLSHAKPLNEEQALLWKKLINNELAVPKTWETELSAGKDKKTVWETLIMENRLGSLALLRNLRNMESAKVDRNIILRGLDRMNTKKVLPFRFIAAAKYAPFFKKKLEELMFKSIENLEMLDGKTIILVDVSGSMDMALSNKSDMTRIDAANGIALIAREICENVSIYTFSNKTVMVSNSVRGFSLAESIHRSQPHDGTYLGSAIKHIISSEKFDRLIVITDEQSHDNIPVNLPEALYYLINVASYRNGVGYGDWVHIDGFSEAVISYIIEYEKEFVKNIPNDIVYLEL
ncbi:MAG TPA: TROVE domain-containing protein [Bacteroidales bacterium]|nr:TROVE domain-containing protein [Bacteroidales bacterium]